MVSTVVPARASAGRRRDALLVFACALAIRLAYFLVDRQDFSSDYWTAATDLMQLGSLGLEGIPTTLLEPLYPLFLAFARSVVGDRPECVQLIQIAVAACAPVCLSGLTHALTGRRRTSLIAGLWLACYPFAVRHTADSQNLVLMSLLLMAFCLTFVRATTIAGAILAGVWLGLAALTRTMVLPLVALAALTWALQGRRREACALAVTALALFAPYAIRNYSLNGALLPTRSGINLFVSTSDYTPALVPEHHPDLLVPYAHSLLVQQGVPTDGPPDVERQADAALKRLAWANLARRPLAQLWLRVKYVGYFFSPFLVPSRRAFPGTDEDVRVGDAGQVTITNDGEMQPRWIRALYTASFTPVLVLAVLGVAERRHRLRSDAILWCVVATFAGAHALFFPASFYRLPMEFILLFFAAVGVDALWRRMAA